MVESYEHSSENSHVNSRTHERIHAFFIFRIILTNHGLADNLVVIQVSPSDE